MLLLLGVGNAALVGLHICMEVGHKIAADGGQIAVEVATVDGQIVVEVDAVVVAAEVGRAVCGVRSVGPAGVFGVEVCHVVGIKLSPCCQRRC